MEVLVGSVLMEVCGCYGFEDSDKVRVDAFSQTDTKLENCQLMSK